MCGYQKSLQVSMGKCTSSRCIGKEGEGEDHARVNQRKTKYGSVAYNLESHDENKRWEGNSQLNKPLRNQTPKVTFYRTSAGYWFPGLDLRGVGPGRDLLSVGLGLLELLEVGRVVD